MQSQWHFKDLIDLEYFLKLDTGNEPAPASADPVSVDRQIYLSYAASYPGSLSRRNLLKYWLKRKREQEEQAKDCPASSPGDAFFESYKIVRMALIIIALCFGASLAWAILSYKGTEPINVFTFLWGLIVPQILLLTLLTVSLALRRMGLLKSFQGLYPLMSSMLTRMAFKLKQTGESSLPAKHRDRVHEVFGLIGRQKTLYGSIFFWPIFILLQIFGVCFNIGVLSATLVKVTITDLAFGWQSTLQPAPETLFRIIHYFALPWSWLVPSSFAHPNIPQIEGSKIILKEGMARLSTGDLISWWPFLCLAVIFYGFLPRLVLLIAGTWRQHHLLKKIDFTHAACDRVIQRMQAPGLSTKSRPFSNKPASLKIFSPSEEADAEPIGISGESMPSAIIFVPEDIHHQFSDDELSDRILAVFRLRILGRIILSFDFRKDKDALKSLLGQTDVSLSSARIIMVQEAWQPPIKEVISWIQNLRNVIGKKTGIILALIGKPAHDKVFTSPKDTDLLIWERAVNSLGDPYIRTENLG